MRPVAVADLDEFVERARGSAAMYRGLVSMPTTAAEFRRYLARFDGVRAIGFVLAVSRTGELAGFVNISQIVRGRSSSGSLGFGGFAATAGHGYVAEGVRLAVRYAFEELRLDRLEAAVQPENTGSIRVVTQAGLRPTGQALRAIRIEGEWRDHERWAIMADGGTGTDV